MFDESHAAIVKEMTEDGTSFTVKLRFIAGEYTLDYLLLSEDTYSNARAESIQFYWDWLTNVVTDAQNFSQSD